MLVIAGHNGAGKSTCYRMFLAESLGQHIEEHIDPDAIEKSIRADFGRLGITMTDYEFSIMAQQESNTLRQQYFENKIAFSFETVLSDSVGDKVGFMKRAVESGYLVILLAVGLDSPERSRRRVDLRVKRGGHDVPTDSIFGRYPRVIGNIKSAVDVVSLALVVDNSEDNLDNNNGSYKAFALYRNGCVAKTVVNIPSWWET
jgi:predicted ABC-type ATPase